MTQRRIQREASQTLQAEETSQLLMPSHPSEPQAEWAEKNKLSDMTPTFVPDKSGETARLKVLGCHTHLTGIPLRTVQALLRSRLHRPASLHKKLLSQGVAQPTQ